MALWIGNDLEETSAGEVRRHLHECPACHGHYQQLRSSMRVLQDRGAGLSDSFGWSIWPEVSRMLPARREPAFNGWLPAVAVAAACLVMVVVSMRPSIEPGFERQPLRQDSFTHDMTRVLPPWNLDSAPRQVNVDEGWLHLDQGPLQPSVPQTRPGDGSQRGPIFAQPVGSPHFGLGSHR